MAATAVIVGDVTLAAGCYIGHGVVIESSGAPVTLGEQCIVMANSVIRSVGGTSRPPFPVRIGARTLVGPACVLTGCTVGARCYIATGVLVFHGAEIGDGVRLAVGSIVHHHTPVPALARVGIREIAVRDGDTMVRVSDAATAHELLARSDFFGEVFEESAVDQSALHERVMARLLEELTGHVDRPVREPSPPAA